MELNVEETMKRSAIHRYVDTLQTDLGATGTVRFLPEPQRSPSTSRLVSQNENRHTVARNLKPRTKRQLKLILHDYIQSPLVIFSLLNRTSRLWTHSTKISLLAVPHAAHETVGGSGVNQQKWGGFLDQSTIDQPPTIIIFLLSLSIVAVRMISTTRDLTKHRSLLIFGCNCFFSS